VSVPVIVPRKHESQINFSRPFPKKRTLVPKDVDLVRSPSSHRLSGILGIVVGGSIIGLSIYSIVRYLL
jgi:hypothetical protein